MSDTKRAWKRVSAKVIRWLHLYASMFSFFVVFFFSITGITLNHPTWFGTAEEHVAESHGQLNTSWLGTAANESSENAANEVQKLEIVEFLRGEHQVRGAVSEFAIDESQCIVAFRAPGYTADAFIDRATGNFDLVQSSFGFVACINDLHKGRDSGKGWGVLIDVSAVILIFVSVTGLLLIFYINRHRNAGLITALAGTVATVAIYYWLVPR
ncbi:MAG: PepSY-associated TM helix domain-containing protein [Planctomycetales bacterium]|nr:PepSY-associated TM helix domain-containing protein [Planctomycetales bacterium]